MDENFVTMVANVRVYEPLRGQRALLSNYRKVTKRANLRKPAASNGLYTLLATDLLLSFLHGISQFF
jgi:hypothetical protein